MKKSQENLLHGCKVPRFILGCVLIIEYVVILNFFMNLYENKQGMGFLVVGYIILTFVITYNNHGKNVRVRYEQELSIVFKSILTNVIMMFFGIAGISIDDIDVSSVTYAQKVFITDVSLYRARRHAHN